MSDPWAKAWWGWWDTPSHEGVGSDALHAGLILQLFGKASPCEDDAVHWVLLSSGRPVTTAAVARRCQMSPARARKAVAALVEAGTLLRRKSDGAFGFHRESWSRHQPMSSSDRSRRQRQRDASGTPPGRPKKARDEKLESEPPATSNSVQRSVPSVRPLAAAPDDPDRDLPEVRSIGTPIVPGEPQSADQVAQLLGERRSLFSADLTPDKRLRLPTLTVGGKTSDGMHRALREYTWPVVRDVFDHAMREVVAGSLEARFFACMFHGGGFGARVEAYRIDAEREAKRRRNFAESESKPEPSGPEVSPDEAAAAAARFRSVGAPT